jgi:hypothetical protein
MNRRLRSAVIFFCALGLLSALVLGGIRLFARSGHSVASAETISSIAPSSLVTTSLPSGYQRPASLAVASDGSAWFWSESQSEVTLFHWIPTSGTAPTAYSLGSPSQLGLITGIQNVIAIDSSGTVWLAANTTVLGFNPMTGNTTKLALPGSAVDPVFSTLRPGPLAQTQAITAISAGPSGQLALASDNSNVVQVLNTAEGSFSQIQLAAGAEATGVAYTSDGTLGITQTVYSMGSNAAEAGATTVSNLLIVSTSGNQVTVSGVSSIHLTSLGSSFLLNDSQQMVSESGAIETSPYPSALGTNSGASTSARAGGWTAVAGSNQIGFTSGSGIVVTDSSGRMSVVDLPEYSCINPSIPYDGSTSTTTPTSAPTCAEQAQYLAGSSGGLFAVLTSPQASVAFLPSAAYQ